VARNPSADATVKVTLELPAWLVRRSANGLNSQTKDTLERELGREALNRAQKAVRA
jgi:hypothetical protein